MLATPFSVAVIPDPPQAESGIHREWRCHNVAHARKFKIMPQAACPSSARDPPAAEILDSRLPPSRSPPRRAKEGRGNDRGGPDSHWSLPRIRRGGLRGGNDRK
ncbi:MAG: hypothetical protein Q7J98_09050 [Kiritimatiellia bacterium]|nr:hypothetical protein [Kiritimatiellia bacterium]